MSAVGWQGGRPTGRLPLASVSPIAVDAETGHRLLTSDEEEARADREAEAAPGDQGAAPS